MARSNTNGLRPFTLVTANGNNLTSIHDGAGQVMLVAGGNVNANPRFIKLYDASAAAVANSTSGLFGMNPVQNFILPGNTSGAGSNLAQGGQVPNFGLQFDFGIAIEVTTNIALADQSGVSAGDCCVNVWFR